VRLLANGRLIPQHARHHFTVFHRDVVAQVPLTDLPSRTNLALLNALQGQPVVDELSWVYFYRLRRSEGMKLRGRPRNAYEAGL
jgi:hypothetical protein